LTFCVPAPDRGSLKTARYVDGSGNPLSFYVDARGIDHNTGFISASRDSAGIQTGYEYDAMGRLKWEKPTTGNGAFVEHQYVPWSTSDWARVETCTKPNGTATVCSPSSDSLTRSALRFDGLGRPFLIGARADDFGEVR
jgi:hypothetical protein